MAAVSEVHSHSNCNSVACNAKRHLVKFAQVDFFIIIGSLKFLLDLLRFTKID